MYESTKDVCLSVFGSWCYTSRTNSHMKAALLMCLSELVFCHWASRRNIWDCLAACWGRRAGWSDPDQCFCEWALLKRTFIYNLELSKCFTVAALLIRTDIRGLLNHWNPLRAIFVRVTHYFAPTEKAKSTIILQNSMSKWKDQKDWLSAQ